MDPQPGGLAAAREAAGETGDGGSQLTHAAGVLVVLD
jgi:hypothetical protein